ncbi:MAG TPA: rod shape-determining protein MreD [Bryobacteraceae bacterium]|nr:rod shape-determining protein MreD [Bryobacteraceae bacterium]
MIPLVAILLQVYLPLFFTYLGYLELPLLVTVYFALMRRQPITGVFFGAGIGLAQDCLSHQPLGMFGIVKTLVGYFAGSVSMRFDVDNPFIQFVLGFFFYFFHQFFYWVLSRALLGQQIDFHPQQTFVFGLLNAAVGVPLFMLLDKIKE